MLPAERPKRPRRPFADGAPVRLLNCVHALMTLPLEVASVPLISWFTPPPCADEIDAIEDTAINTI